jgi:hypothetical protein
MMSNLSNVLRELSKIDDAAKRNSLAFSLFGEEGAKQLLPLISNAETLNALLGETSWVDQADIDKMNELKSIWQELKDKVMSVLVSFGGDVATNALLFLDALKGKTTEQAGAWSQLGGWVRGFWQSLQTMWGWASPMLANMKDALTWAFAPLKDPLVQQSIKLIGSLLAGMFGVALIASINSFAYAIGIVLRIFQGLAAVVANALGALQTLWSWLRSHPMPNIPFVKSVPSSMTPQGSAALRGGSRAPAGSGGSHITVNVSGALDSVAVARQIEHVLGRQNGRVRGVPTWV